MDKHLGTVAVLMVASSLGGVGVGLAFAGDLQSQSAAFSGAAILLSIAPGVVAMVRSVKINRDNVTFWLNVVVAVATVAALIVSIAKG